MIRAIYVRTIRRFSTAEFGFIAQLAGEGAEIMGPSRSGRDSAGNGASDSERQGIKDAFAIPGLAVVRQHRGQGPDRRAGESGKQKCQPCMLFHVAMGQQVVRERVALQGRMMPTSIQVRSNSQKEIIPSK